MFMDRESVTLGIIDLEMGVSRGNEVVMSGNKELAHRLARFSRHSNQVVQFNAQRLDDFHCVLTLFRMKEPKFLGNKKVALQFIQ
jgi:hypothetical protein